MSKIYTKKGDQGDTHLGDGTKVRKSYRRLDVYGTVDELSALLGLITVESLQEDLKNELLLVQKDLFVVGSLLACPKSEKVPSLSEQRIGELEKQIDRMTQEMPALKNFILPGGSKESALYHLARTVARRCERNLVQLVDEEASSEKEQIVLKYLNRLSDYLYTCASYFNFKKKITDPIWHS